MSKYVALLRGINVGGRHSLPMAECRRILGDVGGSDVVTYIQSGNLVFDHPEQRRPLTDLLHEHLSAAAGFEVPVMLRTATDLAGVVARNPFGHQDHTTLHVAFFDGPPPPAVAAAIRDIDLEASAPERLALDGEEAYLHLPTGMGRSKLAVVFGKATAASARSGSPGAPATVRNWRTVEKLVELSES